ncbi:MAG: beta-ketoacyl synthase N-terminal-like domain-containing protein, partial [Peptococcaceae bacterium]|nr:beta-ketoacyl synthase N-terminal-like domain-containing protein [Peptococcaceae bacterium]
TPFVVQQALAEWERPKVELNGEFREYPRVAGVSSFGAGGSNAHLVVEEYISPQEVRPAAAADASNPAVIVISAKTEERLNEQAKRLLDAVKEAELMDIAYTLQVGREAMEERLAFTAGDKRELEEKLQAFIEGRDGIEGLYRGNTRRGKEALGVLASDEELRETCEKWFRRKKYSRLLDLWTKGLEIDWEKLYGENRPRRVSLPTYPFARERYWAPEGVAVGAVSGKMKVLGNYIERPDQKKKCYLKKSWEVCPADSAGSFKGNVAILATPETKSLALRLSQLLPGGVVFDAAGIESRLESGEEWKKYDGLIDLVGCGKEKNDSLAWIAWLQKMIETGQKNGLMFLGVTKGLESYQNGVVNMSGASRAGLYRLLQSEYGHVRSRHMDADTSVDDEALARQVAAEFCLAGDDPEICYRDGKRYRAFLEETDAGGCLPQAVTFPEEHVLWVTGGTRGLGYLCARYCAERYGVRRVVLTGQKPLPPRGEWAAYENKEGLAAQKIKAVRELEKLGVQVMVLSLPLTDVNAVQKGLKEVKKAMGPVGGVIHCAGSIDLETPAFIRKPLQGIKKVLDPKVYGLEVLYNAMRDEPLQFFILFSSVSAAVPALAAGQIDYAMANAFMDYFAEANARKCPVVSIQWTSWKETGMGEVKSRVYRQAGFLSHTDEEGLEFLDHIISTRMGPVVLPAVVNPDLWRSYGLMKPKIQQEPAALSGERISDSIDGPKLRGKTTDQVRSWLAGLFAAELRIEISKLEPDKPFAEYGVDSILLAQLLRSINQAVSLDLEPSILYEYSTLDSLAAWLADRHAQALSAYAEHEGSARQDPQVGLEPAWRMRDEADRKEAASLGTAVVGMSCRFPGANNLEEYWRLLVEGRSAIRPVSRERRGYGSQFYGGFLEDIACFDPRFFLISEEDARAMDPQALLVLEECLKLWYQAGYSHQELKGKQVGVYLGGRGCCPPGEAVLSKARNPIMAVGQNYLAANVSQFFDLRGPSIVVDTACSSALVAVNLAVQALNSGEIESAVVGGVNVLNSEATHRLFAQRGLLNPGPSFHAFDRRAAGVVLGEGVGVVLLKKVEQALADGDQIYAVIKSVAINNDGRTAGPATPNLQAQKEVMQAALARSGKKPEEISYLEANASGSEVTDLLELKAVSAVYRSSSKAPLWLGSVKPNIGHPLCAEGAASLIKVVLMLQRGQFVPFLSGEQPMKHFVKEQFPFGFCREPAAWAGMSRAAGINCFADGGTNAHAIVEAWEDISPARAKRSPLVPPSMERYDIYGREGAGDLKMVSSVDKQGLPGGAPNIWKRGIVEG